MWRKSPTTDESLAALGVISLTNEAGEDWYEWARRQDKLVGNDVIWVMVDPDTNAVVSYNKDITTLWPQDLEVRRVGSLPESFRDDGTFIYEGGVLKEGLNLSKQKALARAKDRFESGEASVVSYTASISKITTRFQSNKKALNNVSEAVKQFKAIGSVPQNFYWLDVDNNPVPFTLTDLEALAKLIADKYFNDFHNYQVLRHRIKSAANMDALKKLVDLNRG